ncbi:MAG: type III secretion system chaperone [Myxococcales bacterium]|nr:type III secretion system chaperone [Myxococcales bacterium]
MPDDLRARVASFLDRFGKERDLALPPLGADGVGQIQRGSAVITVRVLAEQGVLMLYARVAPAPAAGREDVLRQLLTASFTATGDAAFALHPETGDVYLRLLRSLYHLEYEEFEDLVQTIATVADDWDDRLAKALA